MCMLMTKFTKIGLVLESNKIYSASKLHHGIAICRIQNILQGKTQVWVLFFFWPHLETYGILVPRPGIKPSPQEWKRGVPTIGPPRNSPKQRFFSQQINCKEKN